MDGVPLMNRLRQLMVFLIITVVCMLPKAIMADRTLSMCTKNSQCDVGQCCALKMTYSTGFCLRRKGLGEVCNPTIELGKQFTCGCSIGLTCAIVEEDKQKKPKYRCVKVPTESPEFQEALSDKTDIAADAKQLSQIGETMMSALNDLLLKVKSTKQGHNYRNRAKEPI